MGSKEPRQKVRVALVVALLAVVAGVAGGTVQPTTAQEPGNRWLTDLRIVNMAHGGGLREVPQGTMYAYRTAAERGADVLEMDLHITRDGHVVAIHDSTVDRTTNGTGCVVAKTLAEIKALDAAHTFVPGVGVTGSRPPEDYPFRGVATDAVAPPAGWTAEDFQIVTLEELFQELPDALMLMELKPTEVERGHDCPAAFDAIPVDERPDLPAEVARLIAEYDMGDKVMVASFIDDLMARFQAVAPDVDTSFPVGDSLQLYVEFANGLPVTNPNGHEAIQVPRNYGGIVITEELVTWAQANGIAVHFWTVNTAEEMHELLDWGADGLITDEVALLDAVLEERGEPRPLTDSTTSAALADPGPFTLGESVPVEVQVEAAWPSPAVSGSVEVRGPSGVLAEADLDAEGRATVVVTGLDAGTHELDVTYPGSARLRPSSAAPVTVVVDLPTSSTTDTTAPTSTTGPGATATTATPTTGASVDGSTTTAGVTAPAGSQGGDGPTALARTGGDPWPLIAAGVLLVALGAVAMLARRRPA